MRIGALIVLLAVLLAMRPDPGPQEPPDVYVFPCWGPPDHEVCVARPAA